MDLYVKLDPELKKGGKSKKNLRDKHWVRWSVPNSLMHCKTPVCHMGILVLQIDEQFRSNTSSFWWQSDSNGRIPVLKRVCQTAPVDSAFITPDFSCKSVAFLQSTCLVSECHVLLGRMTVLCTKNCLANEFLVPIVELSNLGIATAFQASPQFLYGSGCPLLMSVNSDVAVLGVKSSPITHLNSFLRPNSKLSISTPNLTVHL